MKNRIFFLFILGILGCSLNSEAQILDPRRVVKRKTEEKVNQQVDKAVDKALDKLFEGNKKNKEASGEGKSAETNASKSGEPTEDPVNKLFRNLSVGGTPKSAYHFSSSFVSTLSNIGGKPKDNYEMKMKYNFANDGNAIGTEILATSDKNSEEGMKQFKATIIDLEQQKMFMFMDNNGQKMVIGVGIKGDAAAEWSEEQVKKTTYTKLGTTKKIGDYLCDGFLMKQDADIFTMWISQGKVPVLSTYYKAFSQFGHSNQKQKNNYMVYANHPEIQRMMAEGRAMLGMEKDDKNGHFSMEITELKPNDASTFLTAGYKGN